MLEIINNTKEKINRNKALKLKEGILDFYKLQDKELLLIIVGDNKMKSLNRDYRGIDKTTDVLTFPVDTSLSQEENNLLGEIFINVQEAKRTTKYVEMFGEKKPFEYIFYFLFVHGLLHLIGYNDKTEKERQAMIALGEKFMNKFYK